MDDNNITLKEFTTPNAQGLYPTITRPPMEANNFELKSALLSMVQQNQFGRSPIEDPTLQLSIFLECCDTFKFKKVSPDAIKLRLFPFSLKDKGRLWLHSLPTYSIMTWDQLS